MGLPQPVPAWALGTALAALLAGLYLLLSPPSADLAAATYRSDLFAHAGFIVWDDGWYAGHALPAYSLIAPALGAWLGVRALLVISAVVAAALFGAVASQTLRAGAATAATLAFAFGFCAELPSGRVPYDLGIACALGAIAAIAHLAKDGRRPRGAFVLALALAVLTSAASPVAGAFLALVALAAALGARQARWLALGIAALLPILALTLLFPEGGFEPFAAGAFWPELAAAIVFAMLLPVAGLSACGRHTLRIAACLYALTLTASFLVRTPMGGNVVRLGAMFGTPLIVATLWQAGVISIGGRAVRGRMLLLALMPLLLYWQLATAIDDQVALAGDPAVQASFYAPLRAELLRRAGGVGGHPIRVEVPLTGAHWESVYLPGGPISIARGWERQLDTRYGAVFYRRRLSGARYRSWLHANAIAYVALPDARLDSAGEQERRLITGSHPPLPYLRQVWRSADWRLFAVRDATPLAQAPARMLRVGTDSFVLQAPRAGSYEVRLHWTPYWTARSSTACVSEARGGFTEVLARRPGRVEVAIDASLGAIFEAAARTIFSEDARCEQ